MRTLTSELRQMVWRTMPIAAQEQDRCSVAVIPIDGQGSKDLGESLIYVLLNHGHNFQGRCLGGAHRNDRLIQLGRVLEDKPSGNLGNLIDRAERAAEVNDPMNINLIIEHTSKFPPEATHQVHIRAGEVIDRLPVIADGEQPSVEMLCFQGFDQARPTARQILEFIDKDVFERTDIVSALNVICGPRHHIVKINPSI